MLFLVSSAVNLEFNPMAFVENLKYMGAGMLGIFVVIGLLIGCCFALNHFTSVKK